MTREEAIDKLQDLWNEVYNEDSDGYIYAEALDMAIESLQKDIERHEMVIRASERHLGLVRCKDCRHAVECNKSVQYTRNEPNSVIIIHTTAVSAKPSF